ncbi:MAG: hemolysin family protein [Actinomycetota bacterium]
MTELAAVLVIFVLLLLGAMAAVAESVISRMNRVKALHLAQEKRSGAPALVRVLEDPAPFLNAVLLLKVVAHVSATVLATSLAARRGAETGEVLAAVVMVLLIFVLAEVVPKTFAVQRTEKAALLMARPVLLVGRVLSPLSKLLILAANAALLVLPGRGMPKGPFVTEEEIRHMVDVAEEEEEIEEDERELIHSIFEFGDTVVREVMVPRPDMVTVPSSSTLAEALDKIIEAGYSRIPMFEGDTDNIIGLLYAKDLLKRLHDDDIRSTRVGSLGRAPTFIPEQKKVSELLREMQVQRVHMAIVVDEYGGTAGLVTIEDLIEEIVGEIVDEYDQEEPLIEPMGDGSMRVDAKMPIDEVNELFGSKLPDEEWDTIGGLVFGLTGRVPLVGESVKFDGLLLTTDRVAGRRVQKVIITKTGSDPGDHEGGS